MNKKALNNYVKRFLPTILSVRARKLGITPSDKPAWSDLKKSIKAELKEKGMSIKTSKARSENQNPVKRNKIVISVSSPLKLHNVASYMEDVSIISKFSEMNPSTKDWIETHRYELQEKANKYEQRLGEFLLKYNIKFIHQAPFVICRKIYFLDFFIPKNRLAIEVDGTYHEGLYQSEKDKDRDMAFHSIGINTLRISNGEAMNDVALKLRLATLFKS